MKRFALPPVLLLLAMQLWSALAVAQPAALDAAPLRVYDAGAISPDRYTVIRRIWVDHWHTVFTVPAHAESAAAIRQLLDEAARSGADGVVNLYCLNRASAAKAGSGRYFCYGSAIKLK